MSGWTFYLKIVTLQQFHQSNNNIMANKDSKLPLKDKQVGKEIKML